jgi:hypothetical protein
MKREEVAAKEENGLQIFAPPEASVPFGKSPSFRDGTAN